MSTSSPLTTTDRRHVVTRRASAAMEHLCKVQSELLAACQDLARVVHATPACRDLSALADEAMRLRDRIDAESKAEGPFRWQLEASYTPSPTEASCRHDCDLHESEIAVLHANAPWGFTRHGAREAVAQRRGVSARVSIGGTKRSPIVRVRVTSRDGSQVANVAAYELAAGIFNQIPGYPKAEASVRRSPNRPRAPSAVVTITGPGAVLEVVRYFGEGLGPAIGVKDPRDHAWRAASELLTGRSRARS